MANPNVLTTASRINCPHTSGHLVFPGVNHKLIVQGKPVLLKSDLIDATKTSVSGCVPPPPPPPSNQCMLVTSITGGETTKLKVGNIPVMLDTVAGTTSGLPSSPLTGVTPVQSKLSAV